MILQIWEQLRLQEQYKDCGAQQSTCWYKSWWIEFDLKMKFKRRSSISKIRRKLTDILVGLRALKRHIDNDIKMPVNCHGHKVDGHPCHCVRWSTTKVLYTLEFYGYWYILQVLNDLHCAVKYELINLIDPNLLYEVHCLWISSRGWFENTWVFLKSTSGRDSQRVQWGHI
jgi:hypothetical protein